MNTTLLCTTQDLGTTVAPRPEAGYPTILAPNAGITTATSWSAVARTRKSMTVPAFHDRWPLCSTT